MHKIEPLLNEKLKYDHKIEGIERERLRQRVLGSWGGPDCIKSNGGVQGGMAVGYVPRGCPASVDNCVL